MRTPSDEKPWGRRDSSCASRPPKAACGVPALPKTEVSVASRAGVWLMVSAGSMPAAASTASPSLETAGAGIVIDPKAE